MNWTWRPDGTKEKKPRFLQAFSGIDGGEDEIDFTSLRIANAALSQLTTPTNRQNFAGRWTRQFPVS